MVDKFLIKQFQDLITFFDKDLKDKYDEELPSSFEELSDHKGIFAKYEKGRFLYYVCSSDHPFGIFCKTLHMSAFSEDLNGYLRDSKNNGICFIVTEDMYEDSESTSILLETDDREYNEYPIPQYEHDKVSLIEKKANSFEKKESDEEDNKNVDYAIPHEVVLYLYELKQNFLQEELTLYNLIQELSKSKSSISTELKSILNIANSLENFKERKNIYKKAEMLDDFIKSSDCPSDLKIKYQKMFEEKDFVINNF